MTWVPFLRRCRRHSGGAETCEVAGPDRKTVMTHLKKGLYPNVWQDPVWPQGMEHPGQGPRRRRRPAGRHMRMHERVNIGHVRTASAAAWCADERGEAVISVRKFSGERSG